MQYKSHVDFVYFHTSKIGNEKKLNKSLLFKTNYEVVTCKSLTPNQNTVHRIPLNRTELF